MRAAAAVLLAVAAPVVAQDSGWDVETDPTRGSVSAVVLYEGGAGVAVECREGGLDVALLGLPPMSAGSEDTRSRRLTTGFDPSALKAEWWDVLPGSVQAISSAPARRARGFRRGGTFLVQTGGQNDEPVRRLEIGIPSDSSGLDQVIQACGAPLTDPRDDLLDAGELFIPGRDWGIRHFELPVSGLAQVEVSCIIAPQGRVRDCQIESETPRGRGNGARLLRDAPNVRYDFGPNAQAAEGRILYVVVTANNTRRRMTR